MRGCKDYFLWRLMTWLGLSDLDRLPFFLTLRTVFPTALLPSKHAPCSLIITRSQVDSMPLSQQACKDSRNHLEALIVWFSFIDIGSWLAS